MSYEFIEQLNEQQVHDLYELYKQEWWTLQRQLPDIRQMLQHTGVIVGFCEPDSKRLVAFARVITDFTYKALILDVIVAPTHRDQQLGRALIDAITNHPRLRSVQHFELYCRPNMVPFYEKWGFTNNLGELQFMRRTNAN
ncbi:MAG: GNAT family N-acetyltransferase [Tumebacillaceae bacterium]